MNRPTAVCLHPRCNAVQRPTSVLVELRGARLESNGDARITAIAFARRLAGNVRARWRHLALALHVLITPRRTRSKERAQRPHDPTDCFHSHGFPLPVAI